MLKHRYFLSLNPSILLHKYMLRFPLYSFFIKLLRNYSLIPLLGPEYAADQIIEAILLNKQFTLFPSYLNRVILNMLKA